MFSLEFNKVKHLGPVVNALKIKFPYPTNCYRTKLKMLFLSAVACAKKSKG
jgi:hypothetical protein